MKKWQCGRFILDLEIPKIMGILNLTPDSFSDGAQYFDNTYKALKYAEQLIADGADIIDVGGESTRPNATEISTEEEWNRIKEILAELKSWGVPISLDTRHKEIMERALALEAVDIINDIEALQNTGSLELLSHYNQVSIVLMHMQGQPKNMQIRPQYHQVVTEVSDFLKQRIATCEEYGIHSRRLILDPGFGFGKTLKHNLQLLQNLDQLKRELDLPLLVGLSRKSMLGEITNEPIATERLASSIIAEIEAIKRGANFIRVHNVKQSKHALLTYMAINEYSV